MKWLLSRVVCVGLLSFAGCQWGGNLDKAQFEAHQSYYAASDALLKAAGLYKKAADEEATRRQAAVNQYNTESWQRWVIDHTDAQGQVKASATQLGDAIKALDERRRKEREIKVVWDGVSTSWGDTLDKFKTLNTTLKAKDVEWQKAKEDAAAALDAAIKTLIGAASGIAVGAAL